MATNNFANIPEWILTGSVSQPATGYSKIYPKKGETSSWYIIDEVNSEKRLALDYYIGAGLSQSPMALDQVYGYRLDVAIGPGLTYASGGGQNSPISVAGITPSMLAITGSFTYGYILSTSTFSGDFLWIPNPTMDIKGDLNRVAKFGGPNSLTSSSIVDTGLYVYVGSYTPSNTGASFSVSGYMNIGNNTTDNRLYFGDAPNHYIEKELDGGFVIRTEDEFRVDHYTAFGSPTFKVINFDGLGNENRTLGLMDNLIQVGSFTTSQYLSASNLNLVKFGKTQSNFLLEIISGSQGAIKIQDGLQGSYSVLYSDSQGVGKWGRFFGYNGLTTSELGFGLDLYNIRGLTYNGGTFGLDYTKVAAPLTVSDTFTISLATISYATNGITYGSVFETPTFRLDQWGRIIGIATVSTSAFTGPQGPTGFSFIWSGSYATSSTYSFYNVVEYNGSSYISLGTSSPGLTPSTVTQSWALMASSGVTGPQGPTGISFTWQGTYATSSTYSLYNVVFYGGSSYISITTSNYGNTPSTATMSWDLMAQGSTATGGMDLIAGTFGDIMVYGPYGWTALGLGPSGSYLYSLGTESNYLPIWSTVSPGSVLTQDFKVNLKGDKYFGRYPNKSTIPSTGWTIEKFIFNVLNEGDLPIVNLIKVNYAEIPFGSPLFSVTFSWSYTFNNVLDNGQPATFSSGKLEWTNVDSVSGPWNLIFNQTVPNEELNANTNPSLPYRFDHTQVDQYFQGSYWFKYTVTDTSTDPANNTNYDVEEVNIADYAAPTLTFIVAGKTLNLPNGTSRDIGESNLTREFGNVASDVSGSATRNSPLINLSSWNIIFNSNLAPSPNKTLSSDNNPTPSGFTITPIVHNKTSPSTVEAPVGATKISYKLQVTDTVFTNSVGFIDVNFEHLYYFGPVDTTIWSSKDLNTVERADLIDIPNTISRFKTRIESQAYTSGKIEFQVGVNQYRVFLLVVPSNKTILSVTKFNNGVINDITNNSFQSPVIRDLATFDSTVTKSYNIYRAVFASEFNSENNGKETKFIIELQ